MPEIARFFGIIIRMFAEPTAPHHRPHFHTYYQDDVGIFAIDTIELIGGSLHQRQGRLVEAWAEIHQPNCWPPGSGYSPAVRRARLSRCGRG
jgi:hypothetical protein